MEPDGSSPCSQDIQLEAFVATDSNETFSGSQLHQDVKVFQRFRDCLHSHLQGIAGSLVEPTLTKTVWLWFYQATSNTMNGGTESVPELSQNLHILMWLSTSEHSTGCTQQPTM
jgi:hypothetical protein